MADVSQTQIEEALKQITDPNMEKDLVSAKAVKDIRIDGDKVSVDIELGYPAAGYKDKLAAQLKEKVEAVDGVGSAEFNISWKIVSHSVQKGVEPIKGVKNIIAVASGKGGVGKSTTAVNLALALSAEGATVGILDADIYGPSMPRMLGVTGQPESSDGKTMQPMKSHNVQSMSIGYLIDEETPMIWRGPMVTQALEQLLNDTQWNEVDYLIIDLPPGTGDTQLTLAQKVPVTGALIVTTPQDIALLDARKGLKMFEKVEVPVLGIIENMSIHICSNCGHEEHVFGEGGGQRIADENKVDLLGSLPLDMSIRSSTDAGKPSVVADPDSRITEIYRDIARHVAAKLALKAKDHSASFPKIVIQNN
ncbi:iron-sulfur cluster carrier protein ApbC [Thiohalophilus thiocyanatoxydans]|uniref:Iron-sulfur cluster carrier protein n=1 Tax=Thiohalophilus thiocyanatoxydans TaxID=381308 RepID=A0A4R8IMD9_9GAMM|nr:iron-sulfur cluster carrier protein ApbC [Thiohalophilus thiocyanatoxydans]TDY01598.1 ATP-binding protein involved in chromosome partitioning [Thiohalophilus thiocyanatoxydans]